MSCRRWQPQRPASWTDRLPKCARTHKAIHPSEDSAERQIYELEQADGPNPLLNAYECDACQGWHVGRSSPHLPPRPRKRDHRR